MAQGTKQKRKAVAPLIVEPHPKEYIGYPFITLVMYRKQTMLTIVDNSSASTIKVFSLDHCGPEQVDEQALIVIAAEWYNTSRMQYPFSIELARRGMTQQTSRIYKTLSVEYVSRVVGPLISFPMSNVKSIKRRRRKPISPGVEVCYSNNVVPLNEFFE
jgi:hypothetical protein